MERRPPAGCDAAAWHGLLGMRLHVGQGGHRRNQCCRSSAFPSGVWRGLFAGRQILHCRGAVADRLSERSARLDLARSAALRLCRHPAGGEPHFAACRPGTNVRVRQRLSDKPDCSLCPDPSHLCRASSPARRALAGRGAGDSRSVVDDRRSPRVWAPANCSDSAVPRDSPSTFWP